MASKLPYMKFYIKDYLADTVQLTGEEHGIYVILLLLAWASNDGTVPGDMKVLRRELAARISNMHGNRFNAVVPGLLDRYFTRDEAGNYTQKRLRKEREKSEKTRETLAENSEKGGIAASNIIHLARPAGHILKTQTQTHSKKVRKKKVVLNSTTEKEAAEAALCDEQQPALFGEPTSTKMKRATRLADDWQPSAAGLDFAVAELRGERPAFRALDEFRDYWRGVPGSRGCKLDWEATWRNRVRAIADNPRNGGKRGEPTVLEQFSALGEDLRARGL